MTKQLALGVALIAAVLPSPRGGELYEAPPPGTHTRWISPENDLPPLAPAEIRLQGLRDRVWSKPAR